MKRSVLDRFSAVGAALILGGISLQAADITIFDGQSNGRPWYGTQEDNETEPGTYSGPAWDLEAVLLDGWSLTLVGTYNFLTGGSVDGHRYYTSGDIFIDLDGGNDGHTAGWDYVIHPRWGSSSHRYEVYENPAASRMVGTTDISQSTPWRFRPSWEADRPIATGEFTLSTLVGYDTWIRGTGAGREPYWTPGPDVHHGVTFSLDFLPDDTEFWTHFTMECGNDDLDGHGRTGTRVPEGGATLALLGLGLFGLGVVRRSSRQ